MDPERVVQTERYFRIGGTLTVVRNRLFRKENVLI